MTNTINLLTEVDRIINYKFQMKSTEEDEEDEEDEPETEEKSISLYDQALEAEIFQQKNV